MSKSTRHASHLTPKSISTSKSQLPAHCIVALRSQGAIPLRGIDWGLPESKPGINWSHQVENSLADALPADFPDGVWIIYAETGFPTGELTDAIEYGAISKAFQSAMNGEVAPNTLLRIVDRVSEDGYPTRISGFFLPIGQISPASDLLSLTQNLLDQVSFPDAKCKRAWYARWRQLDVVSLASIMEKEFELAVPERDIPDIQANLAALRAAVARYRPAANLELAAFAQQLHELQHDFHHCLAAELEPAINRFIAAQPQESFEDKRRLCTTVNDVLKQFNLAVRCPKTGNPAYLVPMSRSAEQANSRFAFDSRLPDTTRRRRTATSLKLEGVAVVEDLPRREGLTKWRDRAASRLRNPEIER